MVQAADFDAAVPLPSGLDVGAIRRAVDYIEKELGEDLYELYFEQANVFSAVVGIFGTKALHQYSQFEKKHPDIAAQRFPDLCRRGRVGTLKPNDCLESKGSGPAKKFIAGVAASAYRYKLASEPPPTP